MNQTLPKIVYRDLTVEEIKSQLSNIEQITFEVTDSCNLRCKYCTYGEFYDNYDHRENSMMSVEIAKRFLYYLSDFWKSERNKSERRQVLISFYGGEPLMNMPFIETIVDYVQNKLYAPNRKFYFYIVTNGVLLDKYVDFLAKHQFNIAVSLDGNAENDGYRVDHQGNESFERIVRNIDLLREKHPNYFRNLVNFNTVLHNKNSVEGIYRFFKERYDKIPNIGVLNSNGIKPEMKQKFLETYRNTFESLRESAHCGEIEKDMFVKSDSFRSVISFIHKYSGFVFKDYNDLFHNPDEIQILPTGTCIPFSNKMLLTVKGKILPCEIIGQQHVIGKVTDSEVLIDFEEIVERYNNYYKKITKQCQLCANQYSCIQCLFHLKDLETTCRCPLFMDEKDFTRYIDNQMNFLRKYPEKYYNIMEEVVVG